MPTRGEYVNAIKQAAFNIAKRRIMQLLVARAPAWISGGLIGGIIGWIVAQVLWAAINETEMGAFFLYVDLRTNEQGKDFEKAAFNNFKVQQSGTKEEKQRAEEELIEKFRLFAKFAA